MRTLARCQAILAAGLLLSGCGSDPTPPFGSVIFLHPDGTGLMHWSAGRIRWVGPDGFLAWDRLPALALYRSHLRDSLGASSNAGATIHAYGVKVDQALVAEVKKRFESIQSKPYSGFIQPRLVPIEVQGKIKDVKVEYPDNFVEQMMEFGRDYATLPVVN